MFETIQSGGADQILAMMQAFRDDPRTHKVDLVVGVYKDAHGNVPVMRAVKAVEHGLVRDEETKNYVGVTGDLAFRKFVPEVLLGKDALQTAAGRVASLQCVGGSGALRVGCDLLQALRPGMAVWVSTPTWANHVPVAEIAGLTPKAHPYFRTSDRGLDFEGMMTHLEANAAPGDAIILHACCHNPTGVDLSFTQWERVTQFVVERGILPFVDCAYQGLGQGMDEDACGMRHMANAVPEMLIASSFSKNFGIYRERAGALTLQAARPEDLSSMVAAAEGVIRTNYSMPPSHGAQIVANVLASPELTQDWRDELEEMRMRIAEMRSALRRLLEERQVTQDVSFLTDQVGMFSYTGLSDAAVRILREDHGIYIAGDGRINVAGLAPENLEAVANGFAAVMRDG